MFDLARGCALAWALYVAYRARAWGAALVFLATAYAFALEVTSGFTIRAEGPMEPMVCMLLVFLGPSAMPRGRLPGLPLATLAVRDAALLDLLSALALALMCVRLSKRVGALPARAEEESRGLTRVLLAFTMSAVLQAVVVVLRVLPVTLGADLGNGHLDWQWLGYE